MPGPKGYFESESAQIGRLAKSLPEQVAQFLLTAVQEGAIAPGERLKEETYAERFAVSRSTIREAMALLERRGVVERIPRYGVRVTAVDAAEIEEIFSIRAQLLGLAARLAVERTPEGLLEELRSRAWRLETLAADPRTTATKYAQLSIDTQRVLMAACGGKRLRAIYENLSDQALWRFAIREKAISFATQARRQESAADWARVVDAICAGDAQAAEQAAKALLHASYQAVKDAIANTAPRAPTEGGG